MRSLHLIVKDIESKLGPLEVSANTKTSAHKIAKKEENQDLIIKMNDNEQSRQASNMVNSSAKVEVSAVMYKDSAENNVNTEGSECNCIKNKGSDECIQTSDTVILSVEAVGSVNKDNDEIYNKNKDAEDSNLKIKGNVESTQTNMENASDKVENQCK